MDIHGAALTRLLTAPERVRLDGRSRMVTVLHVIVQQVWLRTLRGDDRAKARKVLMGYLALIPMNQRAAVTVSLEETAYTTDMAALMRGGGDVG